MVTAVKTWMSEKILNKKGEENKECKIMKE